MVANSPVPKLILGETGTGKELCARAIAQLSGARPYVTVNCAAIPDTLVESEFFGYERGAFTGANRTHQGLIAQANGGLLFLDELADVSVAVQAKLLRALESGEYRLLGSSRLHQSTFRIIAATSGAVDRLVTEGKLRADLFYRLGALRITLPPLRDRLDDIPVLARVFLHHYRQRVTNAPDNISTSALDLLTGHSWPGNVRELKNVIEAAAAFAGANGRLEAAHVTQALPAVQPPTDGVQRNGTPKLADALQYAEEAAIAEALRRSGNHRKRAAALLGISEAKLYRKLANMAERRRNNNGTVH
jgi:two-component system, NtrC family, response regulator AtoC